MHSERFLRVWSKIEESQAIRTLMFVYPWSICGIALPLLSSLHCFRILSENQDFLYNVSYLDLCHAWIIDLNEFYFIKLKSKEFRKNTQRNEFLLWYWEKEIINVFKLEYVEFCNFPQKFLNSFWNVHCSKLPYLPPLIHSNVC